MTERELALQFECRIWCYDCQSSPDECADYSESFATEAEAIEWGEHEIDGIPAFRYTITRRGAPHD